MSQNIMTQDNIDKIFKHSEKLAILIEIMNKANFIKHQKDQQMLSTADEYAKLCDIGEQVAQMWSQQFVDDLECFKNFHNK